ncbi:MAG: hypothetical protein HC806_00425 [Anaerolineae bacterium]|nr:hypothetical protein [Anaerolineae bacterium]
MPGAKVFLDTTELLTVTVNSNSEILATIPPGFSPGTYDVKVANPTAEFGLLKKGFSLYDENALTISSVLPTRGPNDKPVLLNISGSGFSPEMIVKMIDSTDPFDYRVLNFTKFVSETRITAPVPWNIDPGLYEVRVYNPSNISTTLPSAYEAIDGFVADDLFAMDFDLFSIPASPRQGDPVQLGIIIRRRTGEVAPLFSTGVNANVTLNISPGGGNSPDIQLSQSVVISANQTISMTFPWTFNQAGLHTLSFDITSTDLVTDTIPSNNIISRSIKILPISTDITPPQVDDFSIDLNAPVASDLVVDLNTVASDLGSGVAHLYFIEYAYDHHLGDWRPVQRSGWKPYGLASVDYEWYLDETPGTHYIQVWASDNEGNVSTPVVKSINYIPTRNEITHNGGQIFRLALAAGEKIQLNLTSLSGDADLFVWGPDGNLVTSSEGFTSLEQVVFVALVGGEYQIDVRGYDDTTYWFEITSFGIILSPEAIDAPRGHLKGSDQPLLVAEEDPGEDIGVPEPPTDTYLYFPIITR